MVPRIAEVEAVACDSAHEAAWLERNLLRESLPPWNRSPAGGQEVEVWIRLSYSRRTPGLNVVHERNSGDYVRNFGPYLGGQKVRTAVSGVARVLPIRYTSDELTGAVRELARIRGASAADRPELTREVVQVLEREPAAVARVHDQLVSRRDAAVAGLSFELAAKLQAEIEALEWISAEQKVARQEPGNFEVCGWAEGMLVRFEVRNGRLCGWSQHLCADGATAVCTAELRAEWTSFALRNAQLAAGLTQCPTAGRG